MGNGDNEEYDDDLVHQRNIMGDMFESISNDVQENNLKELKEYDTDKEIIKYKTYIKKLQSKLEGMGFKFRRKTVANPMMIKGLDRTKTTTNG